MFLDDEEGQKKLKELRNSLMKNCLESERMKAANEIRKQLERMSELEPERKVEDITKVITI